jgi:hypothetical protein
MSKVWLSFEVVATLLAPATIRAGDVEVALNTFYENCLARGSEFDEVTAAASENRWAALPEDALAMAAPAGRVYAYSAWAVTGDDIPAGTTIVVSRATLNGRSVQTCTVKMAEVERPAFERHFFARTDAEIISQQSNANQLTKSYVLIAGGREQLVNLTWRPSPGRRFTLIASSIAEDRVR